MSDEATKNFIETALRRFKMAWQTIIGATWTGGDIRTDDIGSGAAGTEESFSLVPSFYRYPIAGEPVVMIPVDAGKVAAGMPVSIHAGLPASGKYWFVPNTGAPITTFTGASAALRLTCWEPIFVTRATIQVTTNQAASTATIKIYSSNGTLLWTSNGIATTSNALLSSTAAAGVWLNPGWVYIVEYLNTNAAVVVQAATLPSAHLNHVQATRATTAANIVAGTSTNADPFPRINLF